MDVHRFREVLGTGESASSAQVEHAYLEMRARIRNGDGSAALPSLGDLDSGMEAFRTEWATDKEGRRAQQFRDRLLGALGSGELYVARDLERGDGFKLTAPVEASLASVLPDQCSSVHIVMLPSGRDARNLDEVASTVEALGKKWLPAELSGRIRTAALAALDTADDDLRDIVKSFGVPYTLRWTPEKLTLVSSLTGEVESLPLSAVTCKKDVLNPVADQRDQDRQARFDAERREEDRRKGKQRRRALAERHQQGWPATWTLAQIQAWERVGGSAASAAALGDPRWPAIADHTVATIKRTHHSGLRECIRVTERDGRLSTAEWRQTVGDDWTLVGGDQTDGSLSDLLDSRPELVMVARETFTQFAVDSVAVDIFLARLNTDQGPSEDPDIWPDAVADEWRVDYRVNSGLTALPWVDRWCTFNDLRISGLGLGGPSVTLVGVRDRARASEALILLDDDIVEVARHEWWSDGGSAPISWMVAIRWQLSGRTTSSSRPGAMSNQEARS